MLKKAGTYGLSILLVLSLVLNVTRAVWASDAEEGTGGEGWTSAPTGETWESSDPSQPGETSEPTEPSQPGETTEPTEPSQPGETSEPTEPSQPGETSEPTDPSQPEEQRYTVTVQVTAQVYLPDSQTPQTILGEAVGLSLPEDATAEEILQAVAGSGAEAATLESWWPLYAISGEHYTRTTSQVPEALTEDLLYEITYTPMAMEVTAQWDEGLTQLPYGYPLTLPVHETRIWPIHTPSMKRFIFRDRWCRFWERRR